MRALDWGWWGQHCWLATTMPRLVAFGLAPCLPATPTPCPGRAERLLLPVSISKLGVGVGECWVLPGPCLSHATWGLSPMPAPWKGLGCFFRCPFAARSLVKMPAWLPSSCLLPPSLSFFVMAHHFGISSPVPSRTCQLHFQTFRHYYCWLSSLLCCLGVRTWEPGMWAPGASGCVCVCVCVCLEGDT